MKTAIALFAALAALAAPAVAETGKTPYDFKLDLAGAETPEGAARIYADIRRQAVRICRALHPRDLMPTPAALECRASVIENAVNAADRPLVSQAHQQDQAERRFASQ